MHSKYLGLPMVVGSNCMETYKGFKEKMNRKVYDWKYKMLSWTGKKVLIKSCLQSIPLYAMGCLKFPKSTNKRMAGLALQFWWNGDITTKAIQWIRKDIMYGSKLHGDLGFRCFKSMNIAMLMKQLWRILKNPNLLISKIFKQKYFRNIDFFEIRQKPQDTFVSICRVFEIFKSGLELSSENEWIWKFEDPGGIFSKVRV